MCHNFSVNTPKRNNLIRRIPVYFNEFEVSFDVKPTGTVSTWASILHVTKGGNNNNAGDRLPAIWFVPGTRRLAVFTAHGTNKNFGVTGTADIPASVFTNVHIQQRRLSNNSYEYSIKINGNTKHRSINTNPLTIYNAKVYLGDPWYLAAKAQVKNLVIKSEPTGKDLLTLIIFHEIFMYQVRQKNAYKSYFIINHFIGKIFDTNLFRLFRTTPKRFIVISHIFG